MRSSDTTSLASSTLTFTNVTPVYSKLMRAKTGAAVCGGVRGCEGDKGVQQRGSGGHCCTDNRPLPIRAQ
eukprot:scaffold11173_cov101-Isochrysis_galbana.AAC.3